MVPEGKLDADGFEVVVPLSTRLTSLLWSVQEHWLGSFFLNLLGYALIILPAAYFIRKWKKDPAVQAGVGPLNSLLKMLVFGDEVEESSQPVIDVEKGEGGADGKTTSTSLQENSESTSSTHYYCRLLVCIAGLQTTYLTWGVLQERIMTRTYNGDTFTNSQFLVFVNRVLALFMAGVYLRVFPQPRHRAPFYKYSFSSISNTLSSWCQYEALKFVSFPTQVLAKASKVIPVMLMGKVVSNRTYPWHEYMTAAVLSIGVGLFLLAADPASEKSHQTETTVAGVIILIGYMAFDSFTSNWQSEVFRTYKVTSVQMMFGINLFSCILTMGSLLFRGVLFSSVIFLISHAEFSFHALLMSICSAAGQLFIFFTIAEFGPIIFTLIMTTRQALSIIISCVVYKHMLTSQALVGVLVVFAALFLRVYFKSRKK